MGEAAIDRASADEALIAAMRAAPGASANALASRLQSTRGSVVRRWQRLARAGALEKLCDGHWAVAAEPRPPKPTVEWMEGPARSDRPFPRWVRDLSCYGRKETTIVEGLRYG